ncbi:MAG: RHS repeat-associated core domain-containing protein, partial [Parabacteroides sp.]|nr:RHS repeat-associated core domain-containing protein [Parabacteroides sp.]
TYTWEKGRQLKSMHNASTGVTMEFKYNHNGIRTQKVKKVNGTVTETTDYILKGKQIAAMKKNTDTYYFTYDASGKPATVNYNGANYTYVKNLQGDIVGVLDASGNMVVEYMYDAWGAPISIYSASTTVDALAFDNPFRYRGYVWDEETGLYYLRSRYYDSILSRFINGDAVIMDTGLVSNNLFAYVSNNPVLYKDSSGSYSEIGMEFVFDKNLFPQFVNYSPDKMQLLIASGDPEAIPYFVNQNFKKITGHDFYIPSITLYTKEPCCVEVEKYLQYKNVQNVTSGTIKKCLELLSAEKMDEIIDFAAFYMGIPVDGVVVSKIAEGILHIDSEYIPFIDDYQVVNVHAVWVKYNYPSLGTIHASYLFYESTDGSNNCYDGVHARAEYRGKNSTYYIFTKY